MNGGHEIEINCVIESNKDQATGEAGAGSGRVPCWGAALCAAGELVSGAQRRLEQGSRVVTYHH